MNVYEPCLFSKFAVREEPDTLRLIFFSKKLTDFTEH